MRLQQQMSGREAYVGLPGVGYFVGTPCESELADPTWLTPEQKPTDWPGTHRPLDFLCVNTDVRGT